VNATKPWSRVLRGRGLAVPLRRGCERGASAVEYGLLLAGIAAIIAAAIFAFGGGANGLFQKSCSTIVQTGMSGSCS
jgi:pilus assembly protein Flp/PilA